MVEVLCGSGVQKKVWEIGGGEILCDQFFHRQVAKEDKFSDWKNRSCYLFLRRCARKLWRGIRAELQWRKVFRVKYCASRLSLALLASWRF